jgi:hypothetical protein
LLTLVGGYCAIHFRPGLYARIGLEKFSTLGMIKIWAKASKVPETLGGPGLIGLLGSFWLIAQGHSSSLLAGLTLAPVLVLLCPPVVAMVAAIFPFDVPYRILYAFPASFAVVALLRETTKVRFRSNPRVVLCLAAGIVLLLSLPCNSPWRGRILFQIMPSPDIRSLKPLDVAADWFAKHRKLGNCQLVADNPSRYLINAQLGRNQDGVDRNEPVSFTTQLDSPQQIVEKNDIRPICGLLIARRGELSVTPDSLAARKSGHWRPELADQRFQVGPLAEMTAEKMLRWGWTKTVVPPFFTYYEPPKDSSWLQRYFTDRQKRQDDP